MQDQINNFLTNFFESELKQCASIDDLEKIRVKTTGKKGFVTTMLKQLSSLSIEEKKTFGPKMHKLKTDVLSAIEEKKNNLEETALNKKLESEKIDPTLPGNKLKRGSLHPITLVINEAQRIFGKLGYVVAEGPEVETDFFNFGALNFPDDHPARDMHDTFYIDSDPATLLRTHTSNVQVHIMQEFKPPIKAIMPGKVFRSDADVSHSPVFHQVEGLYVDKNVSFSNLKATLQYFLDEFFQKGNKIRLRPSYFPFTEPSAEIDVECVICKGTGCGVCKKTGWIEILGAGMVDPNVLKNVNIDPEVYSGFAFGVGVERLAMLKYGINNIKLFFDNHAYFTEQF